MNYEFRSNFKPYIEGLISQKRAFGFKYISEEMMLATFDRFCITHYKAEKQLDRSIVMHWAKQTPTESRNSKNNRVGIVRQLAKYIVSLGLEAFRAPEIRREQTKPPHIFTREELIAFFKATDHMEQLSAFPVRHLVLPVIFRVIYCCGLRLAEACNLKCDDINLHTGELFIRQSKGFNDRIVFLADDVRVLCRHYDSKVSETFPVRQWFFLSSDDRPYLKNSICRVFNKIWGQTEFSGKTPIKPTTHCFRHTFAVNRMNKWIYDGANFENRLKYLSKYLGHRSAQHTQYYLHFVQSLFPKFKRMVKDFDHIIPEVSYGQK